MLEKITEGEIRPERRGKGRGRGRGRIKDIMYWAAHDSSDSFRNTKKLQTYLITELCSLIILDQAVKSAINIDSFSYIKELEEMVIPSYRYLDLRWRKIPPAASFIKSVFVSDV